jgi:membrane protein implicated in regulation of membrane protease activity
MEALAEQIVYWHWWILAGLLLLLELMASGFFFLWMAAAAAVVGFAVLLAPALGWQYQVILFSALSVISIVVFRRFQGKHPAETDQPNLNRRGEQYVGRRFTLESPVVNGRGELRVDDSTWRVEGPDLPAGSNVSVVGVDGVVLKIEPEAG